MKDETSKHPSLQALNQGAHLSSWIPSPELGEQIFVSSKAIYKEGTALRGGVPICFPQFGEFGSIGKHGFARVSHWESIESNSNKVVMRLTESTETQKIWPYEFEATFTVEAKDLQLSMTLEVLNKSDSAFEFTVGLHTYFLISDLFKTTVSGLKGKSYWDNGTPKDKRTEEAQKQLSFDGFIDRVYFDADQPVSLQDGQLTKIIHSEGFKDIVVWNPGPEDAKKLVDLGDDEYLKMICVESATIGEAVVLEPGESWKGSQRVVIEA